jgi:hypothetical protein
MRRNKKIGTVFKPVPIFYSSGINSKVKGLNELISESTPQLAQVTRSCSYASSPMMTSLWQAGHEAVVIIIIVYTSSISITKTKEIKKPAFIREYWETTPANQEGD